MLSTPPWSAEKKANHSKDTVGYKMEMLHVKAAKARSLVEKYEAELKLLTYISEIAGTAANADEWDPFLDDFVYWFDLNHMNKWNFGLV